MFKILHALHTHYLYLPCVPWQALGQVGVVTKELSSGDVQVAVNGKRWIMNPCCLLPAPGDKSIVTPDTGTTIYVPTCSLCSQAFTNHFALCANGVAVPIRYDVTGVQI